MIGPALPVVTDEELEEKISGSKGFFRRIWETGDVLTAVLDNLSSEFTEEEIFASANQERESDMGVYIHIPFCPSICDYCAFSKQPDREGLRSEYVDAVEMHLERVAGEIGIPVRWIYFGGGTPSTLSVEQLNRILAATRQLTVLPDANITMEMRLDGLTDEKVTQYVDAGVNRFSVGVQTLAPEERKLLTRPLPLGQAKERLAYLASTGVTLNMDLMFGTPGQTQRCWERTLEEAVNIGSDQITAYRYMPLRGTRTYKKRFKGVSRLNLLRTQKRMSDFLIRFLHTHGYDQADTFMFKKRGENEGDSLVPYADVSMIASEEQILGIGSSAYSFFGDFSVVNPYDTEGYVRAVRRGEEMSYIGLRYNSILRSIRHLAATTSRWSDSSTMRDPASRFSMLKTFATYVIWTNIYTAARNWNTNSQLLGFNTVPGRTTKEDRDPRFMGRFINPMLS